MKLFSRQQKISSVVILRSMPEKNSFKNLIPREYRTHKIRKDSTSKLGRLCRWGSIGLVTLIGSMALMISGGINSTATPAANAGLFDWVCAYETKDATPTIMAWPGPATMIVGGTRDSASIIGDGIATKGSNATDIFQSYTKKYNDTPGKITKPITAYEHFGTAGQTWKTERYKELGAACISAIPMMGNAIAIVLFSVVTLIAEVGLTIFGWAMSINAFDPFLNTIDRIFTGLIDTFFLMWMTPLVFSAALWMGYQGLVKKRSSEAVQGAIWMIAAASLSLAFLQHPVGAAGTLNHGVTYTTEAIISTLANAGTGSIAIAKDKKEIDNTVESQNMCALPDGAEGKGWRMAQCAIWQTFVYTPWATGQFGDRVGALVPGEVVTIPNGRTYSSSYRPTPSPVELVYLNAHVYNHDEAIDNPFNKAYNKSINTLIVEKTAANQAVVQTLIDLQGGDATPKNKLSTASFTGDNWTGRLSIVLVTFVAILASFIPIMSLTFSLVILQLSLIFLLLLAPIFLTFGIHPGFGRRLTMGWLEMVLANSLKRIGTAVLLGTLLLMIQVLISMGGAWIFQVMLIVFTCIGFMAYRKKILSMFRINLGGSNPGDDGQAMKRTGQKFLQGVTSMAKDGMATQGGFTKGAASGLLGRNKSTRQFVTAGKEIRKVADARNNPLTSIDKRTAEDAKDRGRKLAEDSTMEKTNLDEMDQWAKQYKKTKKQAVPRPSDPAKAKWLKDAGIDMRDRVINAGNPEGYSQEDWDAISPEQKIKVKENLTFEANAKSRARRVVIAAESAPTMGTYDTDWGQPVDRVAENSKNAERQELEQEFTDLTDELKNLNNVLRAVAQKRIDNGGVLPDGSIGDPMEENVRVNSEKINNRLQIISDVLDNWGNRLEFSEENIPQVSQSRFNFTQDVLEVPGIPEVPLPARYYSETPVSQVAPTRPHTNSIEVINVEIPEVPIQAKRPQNPFPKAD